MVGIHTWFIVFGRGKVWFIVANLHPSAATHYCLPKWPELAKKQLFPIREDTLHRLVSATGSLQCIYLGSNSSDSPLDLFLLSKWKSPVDDTINLGLLRLLGHRSVLAFISLVRSDFGSQLQNIFLEPASLFCWLAHKVSYEVDVWINTKVHTSILIEIYDVPQFPMGYIPKIYALLFGT